MSRPAKMNLTQTDESVLGTFWARWILSICFYKSYRKSYLSLYAHIAYLFFCMIRIFISTRSLLFDSCCCHHVHLARFRHDLFKKRLWIQILKFHQVFELSIDKPCEGRSWRPGTSQYCGIRTRKYVINIQTTATPYIFLNAAHARRDR